MSLLPRRRRVGGSIDSREGGATNGVFRYPATGRITFEENEGRISRLNLEDYH